MPLPRLPRHHDFNTRMETARVFADASSADLVSWVALKNWLGRWDIFFCDYIPETQASRIKGPVRRCGMHDIKVHRGSSRFIASIHRSKLYPANLSRAEAAKYLAQRQAEFINDENMDLAPHAHHFSVNAKPASAAAKKTLRK